MYKNILVTGSNGFIGKNLIERLHSDGINVLTLTRENTDEEISALLEKSDFIFHLAGEVRPKSSSEEFTSSNLTMTKSLIEKIEELHLKTPILFTSTVHAIDPINDYGKTKREAENVLLSYHDRNDAPVYIYRLPHIFGEQCKANYNSVISTWIVNTIQNKEIIIYDKNIKMTYVYVQDFLDTAYKHLSDDSEEVFCNVNKKYDITLGEVADLLTRFQQNSHLQSDKVSTDEFAAKLYRTYQDYFRRMRK